MTISLSDNEDHASYRTSQVGRCHGISLGKAFGTLNFVGRPRGNFIRDIEAAELRGRFASIARSGMRLVVVCFAKHNLSS